MEPWLSSTPTRGEHLRPRLAGPTATFPSQADNGGAGGPLPRRYAPPFRARTSHEQYSKVQTADQQQTSGSSQKGKERPAYRERLAVREWLRQRSNPLVTGSVGIRVLARQAARQGGYFRTSLL